MLCYVIQGPRGPPGPGGSTGPDGERVSYRCDYTIHTMYYNLDDLECFELVELLNCMFVGFLSPLLLWALELAFDFIAIHVYVLTKFSLIAI